MKTKDYCMTRFFGHGQSILQVFETPIALSMLKSVKTQFFPTLLVLISWTLAISCLITREQSARNSFRRQHIGEHCPFKLNTSQHYSVEFGYIDNPRNEEVVLDDTIVRLRH